MGRSNGGEAGERSWREALTPNAQLLREDISTISTHLGVNFLAERFRPAPGRTEIDLRGVVLRFDDLNWLET